MLDLKVKPVYSKNRGRSSIRKDGYYENGANEANLNVDIC
jgi:hypothetical protein